MTKMGFEAGALFELRFWLPVLGDHARFIRDGLSELLSQSDRACELYAYWIAGFPCFTPV